MIEFHRLPSTISSRVMMENSIPRYDHLTHYRDYVVSSGFMLQTIPNITNGIDIIPMIPNIV